jgi:hypothetical protein
VLHEVSQSVMRCEAFPSVKIEVVFRFVTPCNAVGYQLLEVHAEMLVCNHITRRHNPEDINMS